MVAKSSILITQYSKNAVEARERVLAALQWERREKPWHSEIDVLESAVKAQLALLTADPNAGVNVRVYGRVRIRTIGTREVWTQVAVVMGPQMDGYT